MLKEERPQAFNGAEEDVIMHIVSFQSLFKGYENMSRKALFIARNQ